MSKKMHPNSLANLAPVFNADNARENQAKSVASRKANAEARKRLALTAAELKMDVKALMEENEVSALDVLKLSMIKAVASDDIDQAVDIAKALAEFEAPKLNRVEQRNVELKAEDLSDEELDAKLKELLDK